jgi:hypothetical protein
VEFSAVVGRDGCDGQGRLGYQSDRGAIELFDCARLELADHDVSGGPLDEGDDAVLGRADDGIDLPVADFLTRLDSGGAFGDVAFAGEAATRVVGPVAFAAPLADLAQELEASASATLVPPDVAIDALVADAQHSVFSEPAGNLFRAPVLLEVCQHECPVVVAEALVPTRS